MPIAILALLEILGLVLRLIGTTDVIVPLLLLLLLLSLSLLLLLLLSSDVVAL